MKILKNILIAIIVILALYSLTTPDQDLVSLNLPFIAALLFIIGKEEIDAGKKAFGYLMIVTGVLNAFVFLTTLIS